MSATSEELAASMEEVSASLYDLAQGCNNLLEKMAGMNEDAKNSACLLYTSFPHMLLLIVIMAGKELYMVVSGCLVIRKVYGKIFDIKKNHINKGENEHYCKSSCFICK